MQVIRHDYYAQRAQSTQLKQYEIIADRGTISMQDGDSTIPLVLNQKLYTVYADPTLVKKPDEVALKIAADLKLSEQEVRSKITRADTRYVILAKKVSAEDKDALLKHKLAGIGAQEQTYRVYPQGEMAAQVLGFVNDNGEGVYGIEQAFNNNFSGENGELRAVTDVKGVPLAANKNNVLREAKSGTDISLTLDVGMQKQVERIVKAHTESSRAESASAMIMDANTGAIKAMANYPSYDPAKYSEVENAELFNNPAVSKPIEVGSIMKTLTVAAGIDSGAVTENTSYADPGVYEIDEAKITNVGNGNGAATRNLYDLLSRSLNTGATYVLMQMGGGEVNKKARDTWYGYMTDKFRLGAETGIEQGFEAEGYIPSPENTGSGINITYANTSFGQAMTATPIQMSAAFAAAINGGTYYKPHLVQSTTDYQGKTTATEPQVVASNVVRSDVSASLQKMLVYSVQNHAFRPQFDQNRYSVGGKTGTAEIALPGGGYSTTEFNGTYLGFVGGNSPQYVVCVFMIKPKIAGYAGSAAAQPMFGDIAHMLINNSYVQPK